MNGRRDRLFAALAVGWLLAAGGAAISDWPTPAKLAEDRLRLALLAANMVDKAVRPYDIPLRNDLDAQYQELVADYTARFGDRFDVGLATRRHAEATAGMAAERVGIMAFLGVSTALVWWLLWTIRCLLVRGGRDGEGGKTHGRLHA